MAADLSSRGAQSHWLNSPDISQNVDSWREIEVRYRDWTASLEAGLIRDHLADLSSELARTPRVIDLGCGVGTFLRHAVEHCEIPLENVAGVELHESRIVGVRQGLLELANTADEGRLVKILAANLVVGDLLNLGMDSLKRRHPELDLVTMFSVSCCFDDVQFARVLASISALDSKFLMVRTIVKSWDLSRGREDEDDYYARIGYEVVKQDWLPEPLPTNLMRVLGPRKYWPNPRLVLYRRAV